MKIEDIKNIVVSGTTYKNTEKILGSGGFATCFLFTNETTNELVAGKIIIKTKKNEALIEREINIHKNLKNKFVCEIFTYANDLPLYSVLFMEHCDETLKNKIGHLKDEEATRYLAQLVTGLDYLHENLIFHRDIKPENILLKDNSVKITDFGLSLKVKTKYQRYKEVAGTAFYLSPEVFKKDFNINADIWALGVLAYKLVTGVFPFTGNGLDDLHKRVETMKCDLTIVPDNFKEFITDIFVPDWADADNRGPRPDAAKLKGHTLFDDIDFLNLFGLRKNRTKTKTKTKTKFKRSKKKI